MHVNSLRWNSAAANSGSHHAFVAIFQQNDLKINIKKYRTRDFDKMSDKTFRDIKSEKDWY